MTKAERRYRQGYLDGLFAAGEKVCITQLGRVLDDANEAYERRQGREREANAEIAAYYEGGFDGE